MNSAPAEALLPFVEEAIEQGSTIISDGCIVSYTKISWSSAICPVDLKIVIKIIKVT